MIELTLRGSHYEMGRAHAAGVRTERPLILRAMAARRAELGRLRYDPKRRLQSLVDFMSVHGGGTWEMLRGLADGLSLDWDTMLQYTFSSYLLDARHVEVPRDTAAGSQEGCTNFAAAAPLTRAGLTLLAKNRDYRRDHVPLQTLIQAEPGHGYHYLHLGSAGSPGVFSSGMNERGLAVSDTHVPSRDLGPGLPRYALMLDLLEQCPDVAAALDYLRGVTHMGTGTLLLADAAGALALCESGHRVSGYVSQAGGRLVATNHFVTPALREQWIETEPAGLQGNSQARHAYVTQALDGAAGQVDGAWAQGLLADHAEGLACLCRHERPGSSSATILGAVFLPQTRSLLVGAGNPCQAQWREVRVAGWQVEG